MHAMILFLNIMLNDTSNNKMFVVQYPIQFSGPSRSISNACSAQFCSGEWWFNQTQLEMHLMHYYYLLNITK